MKRITAALLVVGSIAGLALVLTPGGKVSADHYPVQYCINRTGSDNNSEFDSCVRNNQGMTLTQYCLTQGTENSSEFDNCVSNNRHDENTGIGDSAGQQSSGPCDDEDRSFLGFPTWYKYLELDGNCEVTGPKNQDGKFDWPRAAGYVGLAALAILLRIASLIAVGYVVYGGFRYITSQGEPENAKSARQTIINAIIGLVIAIAAASIVSFIGNRLG